MFRFIFRLIGILLLAALVSAAWLYRDELMRMAGRQGGTGSTDESVGHPSPGSLARARDRVDSLNGWQADSVLLTAEEMASLLEAGLPREVRSHLDSLGLALGDGRIELRGRLDTSVIPRDQLGPLAGALNPWESVAAGGTIAVPKPGYADWTVDRVTLRGFVLPEAVSRDIARKVLAGSRDGRIRIPLPAGIGGLRVRPEAVALYPAEPR